MESREGEEWTDQGRSVTLKQVGRRKAEQRRVTLWDSGWYLHWQDLRGAPTPQKADGKTLMVSLVPRELSASFHICPL